MIKGPSFKIVAPFISIYTLCLFLPTIDTMAMFKFDLFYFALPFGISTLIFPAIYPLSDSLTEVYGKRVSFYIVITSYITTILFSFINNVMLSHSDGKEVYSFLLDPSLRLTMIGPVGYLVSSYVNIKLISKLKMMMRGKQFVFRSLICSGLSEALVSIIVQPVIYYDKGASYVSSVLVGTVLVKILITIPLVFAAKALVIIYRYIDDIDFDTFNKSFVLNKANNGELNARII